MSDSREESPDWLRSFEPPTRTIELSSESESPPDNSPGSHDEDGVNLSKLFMKKAKEVDDVNDHKDGKKYAVNRSVQGKSPKKNDKTKRTPDKKWKSKDDRAREGKGAKGGDINRSTPDKHEKSHEQKHSVWSLSSDSESSLDLKPVKMDDAMKRELPDNQEDTVAENKSEIDLTDQVGKSSKKRSSKVKSPLKKVVSEDETRASNANDVDTNFNGDDNSNFLKEDISGKHPGPQGLSSRLPLLLPEKVQRTKALVECEGDSIDLSGDVGSVGRIVVSDDPSKNHEMFLDLKGTIYKTTIVPSRTFCVVSFGQSEAKIEAIMNDYIQLKPQSNVYEAETMVEGTLDGFSFDSEDEADKATAQVDQLEPDDEQPDGKTKRKADKPSGAAKKKAKSGGGKAPKKVKKKPQVSKNGKIKK